MSLRAGGVGLNLTAASNVFLMVQFIHNLFELLVCAPVLVFISFWHINIIHVLSK